MTAERGKLRAALGAGEAALRTRLAAVFAVPEDITPDQPRSKHSARRAPATRRGCASPRLP